MLEKPEVEAFMRIINNAPQDMFEFFVNEDNDPRMATNSQVSTDLIKLWSNIEPHFVMAELYSGSKVFVGSRDLH